MEALQKEVDKNLEQGFIQPLTLPAGALILFVQKKNGGYGFVSTTKSLIESQLKIAMPYLLLKNSLTGFETPSTSLKLTYEGPTT